MGMIEVGGEYTGENGNGWKCIAVEGEFAYMIMDGGGTPAYRWTLAGVSRDLGDDFNIKFAPDVKTVAVAGSINQWLGIDEFITVYKYTGDHKFNMTVDFIDGKPDWSTAKVTGA